MNSKGNLLLVAGCIGVLFFAELTIAIPVLPSFQNIIDQFKFTKRPIVFPVFTTPRPTLAGTGFCDGKKDGRYADLSGCAQHFFHCSNGVERREDCAGVDTYFDEQSGDCLFKRYVPACGGFATPKPLPPLPTPQEPLPFPFECVGKPDGDYENPTEPCSELYVSCRSGDAFLRRCQSGLAFDVISDKCLEPQYVEWCPGGRATTPTEPPPPTQSNPPFPFECTGKLDAFYENPTEPCSDIYVSCVGERPVFMKCPFPLKFDVLTGDCHAAPYVEWCGGSTTTTQKPFTTPQLNPGFTFNCEGKPDGDYENPIEPCSEFYVTCRASTAIFRKCQTNLAFDVVSDKCLEPQYVPWCPGGVATIPTEPTSKFIFF